MGAGGLGIGGLGGGVEWVSSRHRGLSRARALHAAKSGWKVIAFQGFLERAAEVHLWAPNRPWVRYPTGE